MDCYKTLDGRYAAFEGSMVVEIQPSPSQQSTCKTVQYTFADLQNIESAKQHCLAEGNSWEPLPPPYGGRCATGFAPLYSTPSEAAKRQQEYWLVAGSIVVFVTLAALFAFLMSRSNTKRQLSNFVSGSVPKMPKRRGGRR